jgi:molybdenum cofactor biosynthesis enzyme MoaA
MAIETVFHATVLSNLARAYDKYQRAYLKSGIPESRFPNRFFLLKREELQIGLDKAQKLLNKLGLPGDQVIVLETKMASSELQANTNTGLGRFIERSHMDVERIWRIDPNGEMQPLAVEDGIAESLLLLHGQLKHYDTLAPRSFSYLPIAIGCEAKCPFCFSKASASSVQKNGKPDLERMQHAMIEARNRGAVRGVITGGGEPGLLPFESLCTIVDRMSDMFPKTVLITNGNFLTRDGEAECDRRLRKLDEAGLNVLAISRHHWDREKNSRIFRLDTGAEQVAERLSAAGPSLERLRMRWVCVLQKGAVDSPESLEAYLSWAAETGVQEVCFKELYVSTSRESVYYSHEENQWSVAHQVSLRLVLDFARRHGWEQAGALPWGSPIFSGNWNGHRLQIVAYTEPSLFWERTHGIARSWNLMSDGRVLVSLEDRESEILKR